MIENLNMDYAQKVQRCHEYVEALEEERRKIQVFQRELPLCLELVTQAIEACRRELSGTTTEIMLGQSECSEQTMSECGPVLEEFIPVKKSSSSSNEDDEQESQKSENDKSDQTSEKNVDKKKSDWLRSVQLWNQSPDPPQKENESPKKEPAVVVKKNGGAFQPFNKEKPAIKISQQLPPAGRPDVSPAADSSSTAITSSGKRESDKESDQNQSLRKQRRCWSPELHRRFLHALQQLGGSHAATPKQIRELMKVDGLTNDEVKSHLQKYRLHTRRPSPNNVPNNNTQQQPQFMVVGGLWVPPPPAIPPTNPPPSSSGNTNTSGINTPAAATPLKHSTPSPKCSESRKSDWEGRGNSSRSRCSSSPATSSSTHTTTASPVS